MRGKEARRGGREELGRAQDSRALRNRSSDGHHLVSEDSLVSTRGSGLDQEPDFTSSVRQNLSLGDHVREEEEPKAHHHLSSSSLSLRIAASIQHGQGQL